MKPTRANVRVYLEHLQSALKPAAKEIEVFMAATADAEKLQRKIRNIGEPDYRDEKAIQDLQVSKAQREACEKQLAKLETQFSGLVPRLTGIIGQCGELAGNILQSSYQIRVATVKAILLPFSSSPERAEQLAKDTDICRDAVGNISRCYQVVFELNSPQAAVCAAKRIEAILAEYLKETPDLMQFLPFTDSGKKPAGE